MLPAAVRNVARSVLAKFGYEVRNLPVKRIEGGFAHAEVVPWATYAPWLSDEEFAEVFRSIQPNTLVDVYRCYELWQLVAETSKLSAGALLEVGVWRGGTTGLMAKRAMLTGVTEPLFACDTFQGVVKAGAPDSVYNGGEHSDTDIAIVERLLRGLSLNNVEILAGIFPEESATPIVNRQFRLCHIDVDVYQSAKDIADWVWPRLVRGGIVVFDDYGQSVCEGITRLVNEYRECQDRLIVHNLNGHGLMPKL